MFLPRWALRHRRWTALVWLVIIVAGVVNLGRAVGSFAAQGGSAPDSEGFAANRAISAQYHNGGNTYPLVAVITLPSGTTVDSPGIRAQLDHVAALAQQAIPGTRIASWMNTGDNHFVSADRRTTFLLIAESLPPGQLTSDPNLAKLDHAFAGVTVGGSPVLLTGFSPLTLGLGGNSGSASALSLTLVGGVLALLVLIVVFASVLAILPLIVAAFAVISTFLVLWGVAQFAEVASTVTYLIALIGLGVSIDYSLLIVSRWREELARTGDNDEAVRRTVDTAGRSVWFSALTVAVGLASMVVLPLSFIRSIGYAGMFIPLMAALVATTLLPVALRTIGPAIDVPRRKHSAEPGRFWSAFARLVIRRRWIAAGAALTVVVLLAIPALSMVVGNPRLDTLASTGEPHDGLVALEQSGIGAGPLTPLEVLVDRGQASNLAQHLAGVSNVLTAVAPADPAWSKGGTAVVDVIPAVDGNTPAGTDVLKSVRSLAHSLPGNAQVGGGAASEADFVATLYGSFPLMILLISVVTFLMLARVFRSLFLPLKAVVLVIISVGAAWGSMVLIWQDGYGSNLVWGVPATYAVVDFVPLMVFAFLFGLSMDYEVFILTRIREEYDLTGSTNEGVIRGLGHTGRLVTSGGLILFLAFASLSFTPETSIKVFATGLSVGIILDATVVRSLLVPAAVSLMGHWNWWLPRWMQRALFVREQEPEEKAA